MPLYDYSCINCNGIREFRGKSEVEFKFEYCPGCDNLERFQKIFSPSKTFVLKGEGWAKDNYSKPKKER